MNIQVEGEVGELDGEKGGQAEDGEESEEEAEASDDLYVGTKC